MRIDRMAIIDPERKFEAWVAHASRVLTSASRDRELSLWQRAIPRHAFKKRLLRRDAETNTLDACATRTHT
jgi:hypothetical protein